MMISDGSIAYLTDDIPVRCADLVQVAILLLAQLCTLFARAHSLLRVEVTRLLGWHHYNKHITSG
jgi:hypothetical protein